MTFLKIINELLIKVQDPEDRIKLTRDQLLLLQKKEEILQAQVRAAQNALDKAKWEKRNSLFGILFGSTKDEQQALDDANNALKETQQAIEDTQQAWNDFIRGGLTENTIADSIAQGFQDGKTSVTDFADFVNTMLMDAVLSVFKAEILGPEITAMSEFVKTSLLDNVLTSDEVAKVNEMSQAIIDKNKPLWDQLTSNLNISGNRSSSAIKGISSNITEDTISAFIGMITAVRIDIKSILVSMSTGQDDMAKSLLYMKQIAENTSHNYRLKAIEEGIVEMNRTLNNKL